MGTFKQLLDTCTGADMDALCARYDGFYRFAKLLERLAEGIADGSIPMPEWRQTIKSRTGCRVTHAGCAQSHGVTCRGGRR